MLFFSLLWYLKQIRSFLKNGYLMGARLNSVNFESSTREEERNNSEAGGIRDNLMVLKRYESQDIQLLPREFSHHLTLIAKKSLVKIEEVSS